MSYTAMLVTRLDGPEALALTHDLSRPDLGPRDMRIRIAAAGVNFPDILLTRGGYQLQPELPFAPGLECAGTVLECGPGVRLFAPGDPVIAILRYGGFATETVVGEDFVFAWPASLDAAQAACMPVGHLTAHQALVTRGALQPGERVLVLGAAGGVGLASVALAAALGGEVMAAASTEAKRAVCREQGATHVIDGDPKGLKEAVRAIWPEGVDVILDPVGGDSFEVATRLPRGGGRLLVVGFASGRIGVAPANLPLLKGYSIVGVRAGEAGRLHPDGQRQAVADLAALMAQGKVLPRIDGRYALTEVPAALDRMARRDVLGKLAIVMPN